MKKRFHSMKFFFLKYKFYFILSFLILVAGFILSDVVYHKPRVPRTEEEFLETLATGEQLFNAHRFEEAREYLIYPANHGYPKAQFLLAQMYYHSWGVEQDLNQALEYYQKAATQIVQAKYMVASMAFRGETKSVPKGTATAMLIQAAYSGYKKAQNDLGIYYNDASPNNFVERDGKLIVIDIGESSFIDPLRPGVPNLHFELPNWSGRALPDLRRLQL